MNMIGSVTKWATFSLVLILPLRTFEFCWWSFPVPVFVGSHFLLLWPLIFYKKSLFALSLLKIIVFFFKSILSKGDFAFLQQALQKCLRLLTYYQRDLPCHLHDDPGNFYSLNLGSLCSLVKGLYVLPTLWC